MHCLHPRQNFFKVQNVFTFLSGEQIIDQRAYLEEKAISILVKLSPEEFKHQMTESPQLYLFTISKAVILPACSY